MTQAESQIEQYYNDWIRAANRVTRLINMKEVEIKADAYLCLIREFYDADMVELNTFNHDVKHVVKKTQFMNTVFLN